MLMVISLTASLLMGVVPLIQVSLTLHAVTLLFLTLLPLKQTLWEKIRDQLICDQ